MAKKKLGSTSYQTPAQLGRRLREVYQTRSTLGILRSEALPEYSPSYLQKKVSSLVKELDVQDRKTFLAQAERLGLTKRDMADYLILRKKSEATRASIENAIMSREMQAKNSERFMIEERRKGASTADEEIMGIPTPQTITRLKWMKNKEQLRTLFEKELIPAQSVKGYRKYLADKMREEAKEEIKEGHVEENIITAQIDTLSDEQVILLHHTMRTDEDEEYPVDDDEEMPFAEMPDYESDEIAAMSENEKLLAGAASLPPDLIARETYGQINDLLEGEYWLVKNELLREIGFDPYSLEIEDAGQRPGGIAKFLRQHGIGLQEINDKYLAIKDAQPIQDDIYARHFDKTGEYTGPGEREYGQSYDRYDDDFQWKKDERGQWYGKRRNR